MKKITLLTCAFFVQIIVFGQQKISVKLTEATLNNSIHILTKSQSIADGSYDIKGYEPWKGVRIKTYLKNANVDLKLNSSGITLDLHNVLVKSQYYYDTDNLDFDAEFGKTVEFRGSISGNNVELLGNIEDGFYLNIKAGPSLNLYGNNCYRNAGILNCTIDLVTFIFGSNTVYQNSFANYIPDLQIDLGQNILPGLPENYIYTAPKLRSTENAMFLDFYIMPKDLVIHNKVMTATMDENYVARNKISIKPSFDSNYGARLNLRIDPQEDTYNVYSSRSMTTRTKELVELTDNLSNETDNEDVNIELFGIKSYPNPVLDNLIIESTDDTYVQFQIFNILGAEVLSFNSTAFTTEIDVSTFPKGRYVIKAISSSGVSTSNFIK
mgnify:CR=1 FL=1|tara:strand:- start:111 stop:1256 length:1146 start_codon:yes stop_codon:yes gene_type:complete